MKKFVDWLVFGPEAAGGDDDWDEGFREAGSSIQSEDEVYDEAFHQAIRRRNTSYSTRARRLDESGGGVIDLQVGSRVFNDVPAKMRTELWMSKLHSTSSPASSSPFASYEDCVGRQVDPDVLAEIEKDIHRTFPGHVTLTSPAGQRAMRDVLRAYAAYDPDVGYSQGMNFIVGLLLTYLMPRHAFDALLLIMTDRGLREYYLPDGMMHLQARLYQLGKLINAELQEHLEAHMVLPVLFASSWVLTCFAAEFPLKFSARVMDCLIMDSFELPIMKVSVAILQRCREDIMRLQDMEEIIDLLRKTVPSWPERRLMDLLTEALSSPWTAREKEVLAEEFVESVADAVRRVQGDETQCDETQCDEGWAQWTEASTELTRVSPQASAMTALTSRSTPMISPFQSGLPSGDLIDIGHHGDKGGDKHDASLSIDLGRSDTIGAVRQLLESISTKGTGASVSGGSKRLNELRDIVLSSSYNYSCSARGPSEAAEAAAAEAEAKGQVEAKGQAVEAVREVRKEEEEEDDEDFGEWEECAD